MGDPSSDVDALLAEVDLLVRDYRASVQRVAHEDALRILQAVDAAAAAAERARRRYSAETHEQARRAMMRARDLLSEARRKEPPPQS